MFSRLVRDGSQSGASQRNGQVGGSGGVGELAAESLLRESLVSEVSGAEEAAFLVQNQQLPGGNGQGLSGGGGVALSSGSSSSTAATLAATSQEPDDELELICRKRSGLVGGSLNGGGVAGSVHDVGNFWPAAHVSPTQAHSSSRPLWSRYESLDYEVVDNHKFKMNAAGERAAQAPTANSLFAWNPCVRVHGQFVGYTLMKWVFALAIGVLTALFAFVINLCVENGSALKFGVTLWAMRRSYFLSFLIYLLFNVGFVLCSAVLVAYLAPAAAGSGIPDVKAYLNGIDYSGVLVAPTLLVKFLGSIGSVAGGLAIGKEGPMVHIGACIAATLTQASVRWPLGLKHLLYHFHNDRDRRDMVTCGAAAGVAAAFRAPVGGVLFALEEATSWWRPRLTWRTLFCTAIVTVVLKSLIHLCDGDKCGGFGSGNGGFIIFDISDGGQDDYAFYELLPVSILGVTGGLLGALFNQLSKRLCTWRMDVLAKRNNGARVIEAVLVAVVTSIVSFCVPLMAACRRCPEGFEDECPRADNVETGNFVAFNCARPDTFNDLATIFFNTNDDSIRNLLSSGTQHEYSTLSLLVYLPLIFALSVITYGISVPSGLFVPCILIGSCYGRLVGKVMYSQDSHIQEGTYALLGAASFLGGTMRMTVSLTVILLELTNQLALLPLVMLVLLIAKMVGDLFNKPIYDIHIELKQLPYLEVAAPRTQQHLLVDDITAANTSNAAAGVHASGDAVGDVGNAADMDDAGLRAFDDGAPGSAVVSFQGTVKVSEIVDKLRSTVHNCFPVFGTETSPMSPSKRTHSPTTTNGILASIAEDEPGVSGGTGCAVLKGTILRSTLIVLLRHRNLFYRPAGMGTPPVGIVDPSTGRAAPSSPRSVALSISTATPDGATTSTSSSSAAPQLTPAEASALQEEMHDIERMKVSVTPSCKTLDELLDDIHLSPDDLDKYIDLNQFVNRSPYIVPEGSSFPKVYALFRSLGLRHILVVPRPTAVAAMVSRKDLCSTSGGLKKEVVDPSVPFSLTQLPSARLKLSRNRQRRTASYIRYE